MKKGWVCRAACGMALSMQLTVMAAACEVWAIRALARQATWRGRAIKCPWREPSPYILPAEYRLLFEQARAQFSTVEGFAGVVQKMFAGMGQESAIRGGMYELACALHLHNQGDKIQAFGQVLATGSGKHKREFDLITAAGTAVECKAISWRSKGSKILEQLRAQKKIADIHGLYHVLYSQKSVPESWQQELQEHGIEWCEYSADLSPLDDC